MKSRRTAYARTRWLGTPPNNGRYSELRRCLGGALLATLTHTATAAMAQELVGTFSNPPSVTGGAACTIWVQVVPHPSLPLPVSVALYSHDLGAAPFSKWAAVVPPGATVFPFSMPTRPVAQDTVVSYSVRQLAVPGLRVKTGNVTVLTPRVEQLDVNPSILSGGMTATGIVTLDGPAPTNGATVELESDNPGVVEVPLHVVVAPGSSTAAFPVVIHPVAPSSSVVVRASRADTIVADQLFVRAGEPTGLFITPTADGGPQPEPPNHLSGFKTKGTVTLDSPAPPDGLDLLLESDRPATVLVPSSTTVPAGATEAVFPITTHAVETSGLATVTATSIHNGVSVTADMRLLAPRLSGMSFAPSAVPGGQSATGTVYLAGMSPPSGLTVPLSSTDSGLASVPVSVSVSAGEESATFVVHTTRVLERIDVEIRATLAGTIEAMPLTLLPARLGDANGDGDVDDEDYAHMSRECLSGPSSTASAACQAIFGFHDPRQSIDLEDVAGFQAAFSGRLQPGELPPPTVDVDPSVDPLYDALPGFDGVTPRPVAAVTDSAGHLAEFVENEIVLVTNRTAILNAFIDRWDATKLETYSPSSFGLEGVNQHLIRINTDLSDAANLEADLKALQPDKSGALRVSSESGLRLLAASAHEARNGLLVGVNWVGRANDFTTRTTQEAASCPSCNDCPGCTDCSSCTACSSCNNWYDDDAFCWRHLNAGSVQDIGVTEAWRALQLTRRLDNKVKIAVLDMGFAPDADFPSGGSIISNVPFIPFPRNVENLLNCTGGGGCPWHGTNVIGAAMGVPDNDFGAAGPAGPVAEPVMVFTLYDFFTGTTALAKARAAGARIINMSYSAEVPAILSPTVIPFELATTAARSSGALLFAAAGNAPARGFPVDVDEEDCLIACWEGTWHTPCENNGVICVGGIGSNSISRASGSNWGSTQVDIFAPFSVIVGPDPTTGSVAQVVSGTSVASPYAAGVAALIWAADPTLSAGAVEDILLRTAKRGLGRAKNYVNASGAVAEAMASLPPSICIASPSDGTICAGVGAGCPSGGIGPLAVVDAVEVPEYSRGHPIRFEAVASDPDGCSPLLMEWTSDRQPGGLLGTERSLIRDDLAVGTHTITATATDCSGITVSDEVVIDVINDPPSVEIVQPLNNDVFCTGETIPLVAVSFDPNNCNDCADCCLPDTSIAWMQSAGSAIGTGHRLAYTLPTTGGRHTIIVRGTDEQGADDADMVTLTLDPDDSCVLQEAFITDPARSYNCEDPVDWIGYDDFDAEHGQYYANVRLEGVVFDPEDGFLSDSRFTWWTDRDDLQPCLPPPPCQPAKVGQGNSITVKLYGTSDPVTRVCHNITLRASDSDGNRKTSSVPIQLGGIQ